MKREKKRQFGQEEESKWKEKLCHSVSGPTVNSAVESQSGVGNSVSGASKQTMLKVGF